MVLGCCKEAIGSQCCGEQRALAAAKKRWVEKFEWRSALGMRRVALASAESNAAPSVAKPAAARPAGKRPKKINELLSTI